MQLYLRDCEASVTRPVLQLCGFHRVTLRPGERRRVTFRLAADQLAFTGVDGRLVLEPGRIELMVGRSAADITSQASLELTGPRTTLERRERFFSVVTMD